MKRLTALLLILALTLCGCSRGGQRLKEPVTFYYIMDKYEHGYQFGAEPVVFAPEEREAAGHREDLQYLLTLYLMGPADEELRSPVPWGTRILSLERAGNILKLKLSDTAMSDVDFTQAAACLTLTCLELTDAKWVSVVSGERTITMTRNSIVLVDDSLNSVPEETE